MGPIRHLLVSVAIGDGATEIAAVAAAWASALGARVTVLNVDEFRGLRGELNEELGDVAAQLEASRVEILTEVVDVLEDLDTTVITAPARARDLVVALANDGEAVDAQGTPVECPPVDLVVMGRVADSGGLRRLVLGSTTKHVVTHSRVPVLVVPIDLSRAPVVPEEPRRLLITTDFSEDSDRGLRLCAEIADAIDGEFTLLHIDAVPGVGALSSNPVDWMPSSTVEHLERESLSKLAERLDRLGSPRGAFLTRLATRVAPAIVDCAEQIEADAIIVPSHGAGFARRLFVGSTTLQLLASATRPLFVLPRPEADDA